jgi:rhodanese-related sulfurtransferase
MFTPRKTVGQMAQEAKGRIENLTVEQLQAEMAGGEVQIIDIRDYRERQRDGWIPGSISMPRGMLEFWLDPTSSYYRGRVDPEKRIVLF